MFEITGSDNKNYQNGAKIKVVGIGGGGCNAVNTMIKDGLQGVEYIVANTDAQALAVSLAETKVQLGVEITKGLGAGANPEVGRKSALDEYEKLSEVLNGADMVFITAGMGGGTGTGAAPIIAKLAKELGALTVGVVTKPFMFEGKKRMKQANVGLLELEENVDSLITIPNQRLLQIAGENLSLIDTFKKADEVLLNAVRGISDLINNTGHINADFADVCTVMSNKGLALMGTGIATGPDRAVNAASDAISSPLLEDITVDGATGIIINITGNSSLTMHETNDAVTLVMEAADEDAEIIFGTVIDDDMGDDIKVTVIATGLNQDQTSNVATTSTKTVSENLFQTSELRKPAVNIEERIEKTNVFTENSDDRKNSNIDSDSLTFDSNIVEPERSLTDDTDILGLRERLEKIRTPYDNIKDEFSASKINNEEQKQTEVKNRTIAERLGFINFDEDELDTPTFLRKERAVDTNPNS